MTSLLVLKHRVIAFLVDDITKRKFLKFLPDETIFKLDYLFTFGRFPNLKSPKTFTEKLQWIKINGNLQQYASYADKYEVRSFVKSIVGQKYLVPLYGVWNKFGEINFKKLPARFVLKATHGSYYNFICKDKTKIDKDNLKKQVNGWIAENFYEKTREVQYDPIKPRIICEKYLQDENDSLIDYKILCFGGKVFAIDVHLDRYTNHRTIYMTPEWKKMPIHVEFEPVTKEFPEKPVNLKEMLFVAEKLSKNFPFVRVDMYSIKGKTYFGELTFTPAMGLLPLAPKSADYKLGRLLDINLYAKKNK